MFSGAVHIVSAVVAVVLVQGAIDILRLERVLLQIYPISVKLKSSGQYQPGSFMPKLRISSFLPLKRPSEHYSYLRDLEVLEGTFTPSSLIRN